jgi:hypothetical protein
MVSPVSGHGNEGECSGVECGVKAAVTVFWESRDAP